MKLKPYPEYKESGVSWLGNIPAYWKVEPGLYSFSPQKIKNTNLIEKTVLSLSYGNIVVKPPEKLHGLVPESFETYQVINPGNIIIRVTDLQNDKTSLRVGIARNRGIITSAYLCLVTNASLIPDYGYFLLHAYDLKKIFYGMGSGLRQNLDFKDIKRMPILIPSPEEQNNIIKYIVTTTNKISRFIRGKRRLIALLKEQKQALINRAVTRGLAPNVRLKPSGVDWLGDIPEHWEIRRLKYTARIISGQSPHENTYNFNGIGTILINGPGEYSESNFGFTRSLKWTTDPKKKVPKDCLLFCMRGSTTGRLNVTHDEVSIGRGVAALIYLPCQDYLNFFMITMVVNIRNTFRGSTFPSITSNLLGNYKICLPPLDEQRLIVEHIESKNKDINTAILRAEREIGLIREYRTRLIADVVTGKIDVRDFPVTETPEIPDLEETEEIDPSIEPADPAETGEVPDEDD